ncbi:hypothetical protein AVEN_190682-1 [Araneus ventricosus]|uniref:Uncharacterized protein n=1 Tax=Araneus ventricosus TaxID=182803 RepID=A0A4Y2JI76_ARAVE|nr:hypothetical protein AVEN_190682-1 [Araneus ventricosus]
MRSDDIVNVMYRENFPRFSQSACAQRFFNSEKAMQGNKIRSQIAFAELRSATSSVGSRRKKLLDDHVNIPIHLQEVRQVLQKTRNSTPGADGISANWFKKLSIKDLTSITSFFQ